MRVEVDCAGVTLHVGSVERSTGGAQLLPASPPLFDQLVAMLERTPVKRARLPTLKQEARAAVAVCLRWGTYLALLADGRRPLAPSVERPGVSRVTDREMARINIEASANLTRWLRLAHEDRARYHALVRAAQALPLAPAGNLRPVALTKMAQPEVLAMTAGLAEHAPLEAEDARRAPLRNLANAFVHTCWRNGPIEDLHAGEADRVRLSMRRFTEEETEMLEADAVARFTDAVEAFWMIEAEWETPKFALYALAYRVMPFIGATGWTTTDESRAIELRPDELDA